MPESKQFPKQQRKSYGSLYYNEKLLVKDKPFPILQATKKRLILTGSYNKDLFKITY